MSSWSSGSSAQTPACLARSLMLWWPTVLTVGVGDPLSASPPTIVSQQTVFTSSHPPGRLEEGGGRREEVSG